jgi:hypothetical protein
MPCSINDLDIFIIGLISSYFSDNDSSINLALSCKEFYSFFKSSGYLKSITVTPHTGVDLFLKHCFAHRKTIQRVTMLNIQNPQYWLPFWPDEVYFFNCKVTDTISPTKPCSTKILSVVSCDETRAVVDWKKFPCVNSR